MVSPYDCSAVQICLNFLYDELYILIKTLEDIQSDRLT